MKKWPHTVDTYSTARIAFGPEDSFLYWTYTLDTFWLVRAAHFLIWDKTRQPFTHLSCGSAVRIAHAEIGKAGEQVHHVEASHGKTRCTNRRAITTDTVAVVCLGPGRQIHTNTRMNDSTYFKSNAHSFTRVLAINIPGKQRVLVSDCRDKGPKEKLFCNMLNSISSWWWGYKVGWFSAHEK